MTTAKTFLGETSATLAGKNYTLTPSFGALHNIEQKTGQSVSVLLDALDKGVMNRSFVRCIIREGLVATYGGVPFVAKLGLLHTKTLIPTAVTFLLRGLGYAECEKGMEKKSNLDYNILAQTSILTPKQLSTAGKMPSATPQNNQRFEPLDWQSLYKVAVGVLAWGHKEFWRMTYPSFLLACEGYAASQGSQPLHITSSPTQHELEELMAHFPDNVTIH